MSCCGGEICANFYRREARCGNEEEEYGCYWVDGDASCTPTSSPTGTPTRHPTMPDAPTPSPTKNMIALAVRHAVFHDDGWGLTVYFSHPDLLLADTPFLTQANATQLLTRLCESLFAGETQLDGSKCKLRITTDHLDVYLTDTASVFVDDAIKIYPRNIIVSNGSNSTTQYEFFDDEYQFTLANALAPVSPEVEVSASWPTTRCGNVVFMASSSGHGYGKEEYEWSSDLTLSLLSDFDAGRKSFTAIASEVYEQLKKRDEETTSVQVQVTSVLQTSDIGSFSFSTQEFIDAYRNEWQSCDTSHLFWNPGERVSGQVGTVFLCLAFALVCARAWYWNRSKGIMIHSDLYLRLPWHSLVVALLYSLVMVLNLVVFDLAFLLSNAKLNYSSADQATKMAFLGVADPFYIAVFVELGFVISLYLQAMHNWSLCFFTSSAQESGVPEFNQLLIIMIKCAAVWFALNIAASMVFTLIIPDPNLLSTLNWSILISFLTLMFAFVLYVLYVTQREMTLVDLYYTVYPNSRSIKDKVHRLRRKAKRESEGQNRQVAAKVSDINLNLSQGTSPDRIASNETEQQITISEEMEFILSDTEPIILERVLYSNKVAAAWILSHIIVLLVHLVDSKGFTQNQVWLSLLLYAADVGMVLLVIEFYSKYNIGYVVTCRACWRCCGVFASESNEDSINSSENEGSILETSFMGEGEGPKGTALAVIPSNAPQVPASRDSTNSTTPSTSCESSYSFNLQSENRSSSQIVPPMHNKPPTRQRASISLNFSQRQKLSRRESRALRRAKTRIQNEQESVADSKRSSIVSGSNPNNASPVLQKRQSREQTPASIRLSLAQSRSGSQKSKSKRQSLETIDLGARNKPALSVFGYISDSDSD